MIVHEEPNSWLRKCEKCNEIPNFAIVFCRRRGDGNMEMMR